MIYLERIKDLISQFKRNNLHPSLSIILCAIMAIEISSLISRNYIFFHTFAELFSSIIVFSIFLIAVNTYSIYKNSFSLFIGISLLFPGIIDILHALTFKGINIIPNISTNEPTQLWICARYLEVFSLLISYRIFKNPNYKYNFYKIFNWYVIIASLLILSVLKWKVFPDAFVDDSGLTTFKIVSEYIICAVLLLTLYLFSKIKNNIDNELYTYMKYSLFAKIISELLFTLYSHPYSQVNAAGHILKIISFYFTYKAVVNLALRSPYKLLYKKLRHSNDELKETSEQLINENKQRQEIEQILFHNEQCYKLLMEYSDICIFIHSGNKFIYANEKAKELIGLDSDAEIKGIDITKFILDEEKDIILSYINDTYKNDYSSITFELRFLRTDGKIGYAETSITHFIYEGMPAVLSIVTDLTDKKHVEKLKVTAEEKSRLLNETLELNKLITEFFSNVSHELKTPINVILGAVQLLESYFKIENQADFNEVKFKKYLQIMRQNSYRLIRLINNLIDLSKFDSGFLKLNYQSFNIVNVIEDITLSIVPYAEEKGITIIFDTDTEEKVMSFDPDKVERILLNLLSNSIKFTQAGGKILVTLIDDNDCVYISVKDTGIGIPQNILDSIFERFKQVDQTIKINPQGSGIGLSLVKSLVELHGGKVDIYSTLGEGTELVIMLPVKLIDTVSLADSTFFYQSNVERITIEFSDVYSH
jgi:PAS domain S-box-containing protein